MKLQKMPADARAFSLISEKGLGNAVAGAPATNWLKLKSYPLFKRLLPSWAVLGEISMPGMITIQNVNRRLLFR